MDSELIVIKGGNSRVRGSVIFVHGLGGDPFQTWGGDTIQSEGQSEGFWPAWLAKERPLGELAFYTMRLPTSPIGSRLSIRDIARQVYDLLTNTTHARAILNVPITFICHSLGGLIIKDLVILTHDLAKESGSADSPASRLLDRIAHVTFIATPHTGSNIATAFTTFLRFASPTFGDLSATNEELARNNAAYREICRSRVDSLRNASFHEKAPVWGNIIVPEASGDPGLPGVSSTPIDADHFAICKPRSKNDQVYQSILGMLANLAASRPEPEAWIAAAKARAKPFAATTETIAAASLFEQASDQPASRWATFRTISAILALAVGLGAFAEGLRRWSRPVSASPTNTSMPQASATAEQPASQQAPKPKTVATPKAAAPKQAASGNRVDDEARRAAALKRLEQDVAEAEAKRTSLVATQNAIAQATSVEQLDMLATLYPELAPAIDVRRTSLGVELRLQEAAEKDAEKVAEAELATATDQARIAEIGARWPALQPHVDARLASLKTESEKKQPDPKVAALDRVTRAAQDGLRRVGCFSGPSTGTWGPKTKKAAETFNTHAKTKIAADAPTEAAETVLSAVKARVCPLDCVAPKVAVEGKCAVVTCAAGTIPAAGGVCEQAYVAWVGSHETQVGAAAHFAGLQQAHIELLRDRPPEIKAAANGQRFSIRIGPAASKDAVRDLCAKLKGAGLAAKCYPAPL